MHQDFSLTQEQYRQLWDPELKVVTRRTTSLSAKFCRRSARILVQRLRSLIPFRVHPNYLKSGCVAWGDIEDSLSLSRFDSVGGFDALLAMGVLPHVEHEIVALENMRHLLKPGGTVFVECRNKLFSLFTFNRFTYEFILDDLLAGVTGEVRDQAAEFLATRVDMNMPPLPSSGHEAKYHNPLTIEDSFLDAGFTDIEIMPFHYHAAMPRFEKPLGAAFRAQSIALENEPSGWRGLFLCSAFVVRAQRPEVSG